MNSRRTKSQAVILHNLSDHIQYTTHQIPINRKVTQIVEILSDKDKLKAGKLLK